MEAYFKLNSIQGGKGVTDGKIRYWYDSKILISVDNIIVRTAPFPDMKLNKFLIAPYIGDGSPIEQTMWIDDLIVATSPLLSYIDANINVKENSISPNPAIDFIEISYPPLERGSGGVNIKIYNIFGQNVSTPVCSAATPASGGQRIDVSGLAPGIYFVRIGDRVQKFIKI